MIVLVSDRIYTKTKRFLEKIRKIVGRNSEVHLALIDGFGAGLDAQFIIEYVSSVITGSVDDVAYKLQIAGGTPLQLIALNQSAILPTIAIAQILGLPFRKGLMESCDKRLTRRLLSLDEDLAIDFCEVMPGQAKGGSSYFEAQGYVVKPAFGMSSSDVSFWSTWIDAFNAAESTLKAKEWLPRHVSDALNYSDGATSVRLIESYIEGTEFSIDGWIRGDELCAIVQHKLSIVRETFVGDGPTISPPVRKHHLPSEFNGLETDEGTLIEFGRKALQAIGFSHGVFHIEARERWGDLKLCLIEVNPRAPGGSLWRSALHRFGYDLELIDAALQLGRSIPRPETSHRNFVMHYPFYAKTTGVLKDWGDLVGPAVAEMPNLTIDFAVSIGEEFSPSDLLEEPYLAFAVTHDDSLRGILEQCSRVLSFAQPSIKAINIS